MKFIHCADLHLGSPLTSKLSPRKSEIINAGIFASIQQVINTCRNNQINVVVVAGDLFDLQPSPNVVNRFKMILQANQDIKFLFVYGNHDQNAQTDLFNRLGENFIVLKPNQSSKEQDVTFTAYSPTLAPLPQNGYNVVIAHGDINGENKINLTNLKGKNVDYLALGHIHKSKTENIDERGVWTYCGSLCARGWDETGEKGYYIIDTDLKTFTFTPSDCIKFSIIEKSIDLYSNLLEFENSIIKELNRFGIKDAIRLVIKGEIKDNNFIDFSYLKTTLQDRFFHFELIDQTTVNYSHLLDGTTSLKTEFLKVVKSKNLPTQTEKEIIETGLKYLK